MAIEIGEIEVISNGRALVDIQGANGKYDNFQPNVTDLTGTQINFNNPFNNVTLSANRTFTFFALGAGKTTIVNIDTSADLYTPVFDSGSTTFQWQSDAEPDWATRRYWTVSLVCWSGTVVRASATGYDVQEGGSTSPGAPEIIDLGNGLRTAPTGINPESAGLARAGFSFLSNGELKMNNVEGELSSGNIFTQTAGAPSRWCSVTPTQTYYIRATILQNSTHPDGTLGFAQGTSLDNTSTLGQLGPWYSLAENRTWCIEETDAGSLLEDTELRMRIEIASDDNEDSILASNEFLMICNLQAND